MAKILTAGSAVMDIIHTVNHYPQEDEEIRALEKREAVGGNSVNTAVVLGKLGHQCGWMGSLADDLAAGFIKGKLTEYRIDYSLAAVYPGQSPVSVITLNQGNGSRTIIHYRTLPELQLEEKFKKTDFGIYDWIHLEGRNIAVTLALVEIMKKFPVKISVEIEKPRGGEEALFPFADVLVFGKSYLAAKGSDHPEDYMKELRKKVSADIVCPWGEQGAWGMSGESIIHIPAYRPERIVDTIGAGDAFNAGLVDGYVNGLDFSEIVTRAVHIAGKKCGTEGFAL